MAYVIWLQIFSAIVLLNIWPSNHKSRKGELVWDTTLCVNFQTPTWSPILVLTRPGVEQLCWWTCAFNAVPRRLLQWYSKTWMLLRTNQSIPEKLLLNAYICMCACLCNWYCIVSILIHMHVLKKHKVNFSYTAQWYMPCYVQTSFSRRWREEGKRVKRHVYRDKCQSWLQCQTGEASLFVVYRWFSIGASF